MKLHTGAMHPRLTVQVDSQDLASVGHESDISTEKSIVHPVADDTSKSSKVYTLVIWIPSVAFDTGLDDPPSLDEPIVTPFFLNVTIYGPIPSAGVACNVIVSPEYFMPGQLQPWTWGAPGACMVTVGHGSTGKYSIIGIVPSIYIGSNVFAIENSMMGGCSFVIE